ncbi:branched-chain alpha-keto acid dehydrogenase subunit E2 [Paenibacillus oryzae]|uniref:Branched-chain alpha-keto acid dehydrogenase subunit E2 n=1 Tax=Paenibacillus oryzae TaxID=1844972 RepID=A0A1A5YEZ8_9BACL|nr:suppressor of fused domain protein [Paenibacillus oryzae]OBR64147.1 branched-chain alpha-keto acid dehydrogenase subunit E2 [Paenibacillus oryzae]
MSEEVDAIGWNAIDTALENIYGEQQARHYGTSIPYMLGGNDPLDGISVYSAEQPVPHWHYVTYGFSDLYEKESEDETYSGYGFELTMRLAKEPGEDEPPAWCMNLLQNLARYVFKSGNVFHSGDHMDANSPIRLESDTRLTALGFVTDPVLGEIHTPNGMVEFVQVVGITADELQATQMWNTNGLLETLKTYYPLYMTDLERPSILERPEALEAITDGAKREGSSTGILFVEQLDWRGGEEGDEAGIYILTVGAKQAAIVGGLLSGRLPYNRTLTLVSSSCQIVLKPGESNAVEERDGGIDLLLSPETAQEWGFLLQPVAGKIIPPSFPSVIIEIVPTHIKDTDGNIVQTIG